MGKRVNRALLGRIEARMAALDIRSDSELERRGGLAQGFLQNIRQGKTQWPGSRNMRKLVKALDCVEADLQDEKPTESATVNHSLSRSAPPSDSAATAPTEGPDPMDSERWKLLEDIADLPEEAIPGIRKMLRRLWGGGGDTPHPQKRRKT